MQHKRRGKLISSLEVIEQAGGAVLFDRHSGKYLQTNQVGSELIRGLLAGKSVDAMRLQISENYGISIETVTQDTSVFLNELVKLGLIE